MARRDPRDIVIEDHGSLILLRPLNDGADKWLREHTAEDAQWFGGALVVEPRYVSDIVNGAINDGLVVRRGYSAILGVVTRPR